MLSKHSINASIEWWFGKSITGFSKKNEDRRVTTYDI